MKKIISIIITIVILLTCISCNETTNNSSNKKQKSETQNTENIKYTVDFETYKGTPVNSLYTNKIDEAPLTAKDDHYFLGWYLDNSFTKKAEFPLEINKDTTLYAKWEKIKYYVYFEYNDGRMITFQKTDCLTYTPVPERANYLFDGWYTDKSCQTPVTTPLNLKNDITLYANWLQLKSIQTSSTKTTIDSDAFTIDSAQLNITPQGFNFNKLAKLNYNIKITVTYEVYYTKDYNVLLDIGYLGAPKFETYIIQSGTKVYTKEDQTAQKAITSYTATYKTSAYDLINKNLSFKVSSDNIQNKLYVQNINITYECYK